MQNQTINIYDENLLTVEEAKSWLPIDKYKEQIELFGNVVIIEANSARPALTFRDIIYTDIFADDTFKSELESVAIYTYVAAYVNMCIGASLWKEQEEAKSSDKLKRDRGGVVASAKEGVFISSNRETRWRRVYMMSGYVIKQKDTARLRDNLSKLGYLHWKDNAQMSAIITHCKAGTVFSKLALLLGIKDVTLKKYCDELCAAGGLTYDADKDIYSTKLHLFTRAEYNDWKEKHKKQAE